MKTIQYPFLGSFVQRRGFDSLDEHGNMKPLHRLQYLLDMYVEWLQDRIRARRFSIDPFYGQDDRDYWLDEIDHCTDAIRRIKAEIRTIGSKISRESALAQ